MTHREQASVNTADLLVAQIPRRSEPMTTLSLPATDPRGAKAVSIATDAGQWLKCRTRDGRKAYGIRSSRDANIIHLVTRTSCDCYDARRHECKHMLAVRLHCELVAEQQQSDDVSLALFARFEQDDRPLPTPDLSRILGRPRRGVIPAAEIVRED